MIIITIRPIRLIEFLITAQSSCSYLKQFNVVEFAIIKLVDVLGKWDKVTSKRDLLLTAIIISFLRR